MPTLKTANTTLLLLASASMLLAGQEAPRTDINPALLYYQAVLLEPGPMLQADLDYLGSPEGYRWGLPERYRGIVAGYDNQFKLVRLAAHSTAPCDWGVDLTAGPSTLLPQLAAAKKLAITADLRVHWELQHDRQTDARDDLLAAFVLGRNNLCNGILVSVLCQYARESTIYFSVAQYFGEFSPATLQQLMDGFDAAPPRATVASCIPAENAISQDWLVRRIREIQTANPGDDAKVMAAVRGLFPGPFRSPEAGPDLAGWWDRLAKAAGGTSQGVIDLIRGLEPFNRRAAAITELPYGPAFDQQSEAFSKDVQDSPNPLARVLIPDWQGARRREFKAQVFAALVRAAIQYKLHGDAGFKSVSDPCGHGPLAFRRFIFQGVDRGFQITSAFDRQGPQSLIFVEKEGDPFFCDGPHIGQARR